MLTVQTLVLSPSLTAGARFNLGQYIDFDTWKFSQIETMRYAVLQRPGYSETGSVAALQLQNQGIANILTFGVGARISALSSDKWLSNTRELRIIATYDVIHSGNVSTANFIVGSNDFAVSTSPARGITAWCKLWILLCSTNYS